MVNLIELQEYLSKLLFFPGAPELTKVDPFMANGLQVRGRARVKKIGFGVSASLELFKQAAEKGCAAIVVHHAINFPPVCRYDAIFQQRYKFLLEREISLFGYHFLLDGHPRLGHNVLLLQQIGAAAVKPYFYRGAPWGWYGELKVKSSRLEVKRKLGEILSKRSVWYEFGPEDIGKVVAISGKGAPYAADMQELIDERVDLFITGETHEWVRELFREARVNFVGGGHYATEKLGVKRLQAQVAQDLAVETVFLELDNEV